MRPLRAPVALLALLTLLALPARAPLRAQGATPDFAGVRALVAERMARDSLPGLAIAVARDGATLWEEGFGWADRDAHVPATAATPFYLASVGKTIAATAAVLLHERGRLALDRPANDYLGAAPVWSPRWDPTAATVRRLITHTAGLTTFNLGCAADRPTCELPSVGETIRRWGVLVWPPGERFDYSNLGYHVLDEVIARAAGRELGAFVRDELLRPLGMAHTSVGVAPDLVRQTAVRYGWAGAHTAPRAGAGATGLVGFYGSAHDLARFGSLHVKARPRGQPALLSDSAIDEMQRSAVATSADGRSGYGLGWWVDEDRFGYRSVLAQGGTTDSQAWLRLIPSERLVVALVANKGVGFPEEVVDSVVATLLPRYGATRAARAAAARGSGQPSPSPAAARAPLPDSLAGRWVGLIRTSEGDVALDVTVADTGAATATLGARPAAVTGRARLGDGLFLLTLPGDPAVIGDRDASGALSFYLVSRDGKLDGTVTTRPPAGSGLDGRVSYWVALARPRS